MAYPHKWSPISYKSSAGQRKDTGQRPMLYRWTTQPTSKERVAGSPSNTMWPGPRPTRVASFILIPPNVWPQCTNVTDIHTDRQTDRQTRQTGQRTDSIGQTVFSERELTFTFAICCRPSVCLSSVCRLSVVCLSSVTLVHPTQAVQIFGDISTVFGTLAIR